MLKFKSFLSKNKEYFSIIAIIVAIIFSIYLIVGVFPFGTKTIAHYDMIAQTIPLSELVFDWLKGESPLFYSTSIGLGANTFGYLIYFILSPFNLLTLLGGEGNLFYSVNIVFLLKLITIGCIACWFIKKYFKNIGSIATISFSILYTFCGYMLFNYTYLSFLDYLIYAPIFIFTFDLLKNKNKIWPMSLVVFLMILSCFSLGCFVLIYLAVIFSAYVFIAINKEDRGELIVKTISSTLIAIAFALPILIPSFWQFLSSSRSTTISILDTAFAIALPTKIGVIITDIVTLFFTIFYFKKCNKKDCFNKFLISIGILTLITTFSDESLMLFNGGITFGYYSRFGFVGAIYLLSLACLYFDKFYKKSEINNKSTVATNYVLTLIYILVFSLFVYIAKQNLKNLIRAQQLSWVGLITYLIVFIMFVVPLILTLLTKKTTGNQLKIMASIIAIVTALGASFIHLTNNTNDTVIFTQTSQILQQIDNNYRIKLPQGYISNNNTTIGVKSLDSFSSLSHKNLNKALSSLGFEASTNNVKSYGGTVLSDIFVGNKFLLSEYKMNYNYLKLIEEKNNLYLYENLLCTKLGKVLQQELNFTEDIVENQNVLFHSLGGNGDLLEQITPELTLKNGFVDKNGNYSPQDNNYSFEIQINYKIDSNKVLYLCSKNTSYSKNKLFSNEFIISDNCFIPIVNDDFLTIKCFEKFSQKNLTFYELDLAKLQNLQYQSFDIKEFYSGFNAKVSLSENSQVFLPYINIEGYSIISNQSSIKSNPNPFIILNLAKGENNLTITFKNNALKYNLIGLLIGIVLFIFSILILKLKNKISKKFVTIAFLCFAISLVSIFIVFPVGVTIVKCICFIF